VKICREVFLLSFRLLSWHLLGKAEVDRYLLMLWAPDLSCSVERKWDCRRTGEDVNRGGCGFFGAFAKLRKGTVGFVLSISVCRSLCPHGTTRLPLDGFFFKFSVCVFVENVLKKLGLIKVWQAKWVLYVNTNTHFRSYFTQFFLRWHMFQTKLWWKSVHTFYDQCPPPPPFSKKMPFVR